MKILLQVLACAGMLCVAGARDGTPPYLVVEAPGSDGTAAERGAERFPSGAKLWLVTPKGERRQIAPGFFAAADPDVSFDARKVLFAGRQSAGSKWAIWEADLAGGAFKRIGGGTADCIRPVYLPDGVAYAKRAPEGFQIEKLTGPKPERLTFAPGNWLPSQTLEDGRILLDGPHAAGRDIYTLYSDGSGIETVRCDHGRPRRNAREAAGGDIAFQTAGGAHGRFTRASATALSHTGPVPRIAVVPRPVPKRHPTGLHNRDGANLLCLDSYTSKLDIPEGSVARVRVIAESGVLGDAPVAKDGSWYAQVPSDRALRFELLDKAGRVLAKQEGWMWARRGEQRLCVGCHAGPERAPENAVPEILNTDLKPVNLAGGRP